ncbi:hypothetical protein ACF1AE_16025 [Streptomyces sp. NPDC014986]|uniref:hypothetical protein n=1 Tax=Streptomyces sp. NPDC014986 TaxID=3364934 RepID=UPI0037018EF3
MADLRDRRIGGTRQVPGALGTAVGEVLARSLAVGLLEARGKWWRGQPACTATAAGPGSGSARSRSTASSAGRG